MFSLQRLPRSCPSSEFSRGYSCAQRKRKDSWLRVAHGEKSRRTSVVHEVFQKSPARYCLMVHSREPCTFLLRIRTNTAEATAKTDCLLRLKRKCRHLCPPLRVCLARSKRDKQPATGSASWSPTLPVRRTESIPGARCRLLRPLVLRSACV